MSRSRAPIHLAFALLIATVVTTVVMPRPAAAAGTAADELARLLADIPAERIPSGILYDRALPLSSIADHDGTPGAPPATLAAWKQMAHEMGRASLAAPTWPSLAAIEAGARLALARGVVPIAVMNLRYERIRPDALATGALVARDGRLALGSGDGDPFVAHRVFAAAPLRETVYQGAQVTFALGAADYLTNDPAPPAAVEIDFADGLGYVPVALGAEHGVRYATPGRKLVRLRAAGAGGPLHAAFHLDVAALVTPAPDDTLHITASIPHGGILGTGDAYVYLSPGHTALTDPVIVLEGFDYDNSMNWDELYALLNREQLLETLRARGYDAVVMNFTDAVAPIQRNAFVAAELIRQVQAAIPPDTDIALAGASMGGLIGRYALAHMETNGLPHRIRTFIAFDSPQDGAAIPLGIQYWLSFFADDSPEAAALLAALDTPGARQMLAYHHTDPPGATGESDPLRDALILELAALGDYPTGPRLVAIANGSGSRAGQGFAPGDQIIRWEYSSFLVDIVGNVWAVPDQTSRLIFRGLIDFILLPPDELNVTVAGTRPFDSAPGGWRDSMAEMDATPAPYGDIVALHPNHCFIPAVSALAVETSDLFYDIAGDPDLLAHTPFDAVYFPAANEEHVLITPANAAWFLAEIERPAAGIAGDPAAPAAAVAGVARVSAAPNPAPGAAIIRYSVPAAGPVELRIYGPAGRPVATLLDRRVEAGAGEALWDGTDAAGRRVAAGVYFIRLRGDNFAASRKILLNW